MILQFIADFNINPRKNNLYLNNNNLRIYVKKLVSFQINEMDATLEKNSPVRIKLNNQRF
jgi:hypothetical protein